LFRLPHTSLSVKITAAVVVTVLLIGGSSSLVLRNLYREQMVETMAASTTVLGELIEESLHHAMLTGSPDRLMEMVQSLAGQEGVENVMILDKKGVVRVASKGEDIGRVMAKSDPTCSICHIGGPSVRGKTVIYDSGDEHEVFRNVNPIPNVQSCWECHPKEDPLNGVLIVDYSMERIETMLDDSSRKFWLLAAVLAIATASVIIVFVRRLVLLRLIGLVKAVDSIEEGQLNRPIRVEGVDEISRLGEHLNRMASSLHKSLRDLRQRELFLDAVINSADDGIVVLDENMNVVAANKAFEKLMGAKANELIGERCKWHDFCKGHDPGLCPTRLTLQTGEGARCVRRVKQGEIGFRCFEITSSPLINVEGPPQVLELWRDISERREMESQLAQTERLSSLGLLASGISHEINNPLASILTCLDGLRRRQGTENGDQYPDDLPEYLELIRGEVERCRVLTKRLQMLARKPRYVRQPIDLSAVAHDIVALVHYEAEKSSVKIEEELAPGLGPLLTDESMVHQVILNILLNAIQSIDGSGIVRIVTSSNSKGLIQIEIIDTGRGIEAAVLQKIFEPFFSARPDESGTGLGLFISKVIVDQLKGSIEVESVPGKGTHFTIIFPTSPDAITEDRV